MNKNEILEHLELSLKSHLEYIEDTKNYFANFMFCYQSCIEATYITYLISSIKDEFAINCESTIERINTAKVRAINTIGKWIADRDLNKSNLSNDNVVSSIFSIIFDQTFNRDKFLISELKKDDQWFDACLIVSLLEVTGSKLNSFKTVEELKDKLGSIDLTHFERVDKNLISEYIFNHKDLIKKSMKESKPNHDEY